MMTAFIESLRGVVCRGRVCPPPVESGFETRPYKGLGCLRCLEVSFLRSGVLLDCVRCAWVWLPRGAYLLPLPSTCLRSCFPPKSLHYMGREIAPRGASGASYLLLLTLILTLTPQRS